VITYDSKAQRATFRCDPFTHKPCKNRARDLFWNHAADPPQQPDLKLNVEFLDQSLLRQTDKRVVVVQSNCGTNKTGAMITEALRGPSSLFMSSRITHGQGIAARCNAELNRARKAVALLEPFRAVDCVMYTEASGAEIRDSRRLCLSVESLHKRLHGAAFDTVVLDEIELLRDNVVGPTNGKHHTANVKMLEYLLSKANRIVVLDANVSASTMAWLEGCFGGRENLFYIRNNYRDDRAWHLYADAPGVRRAADVKLAPAGADAVVEPGEHGRQLSQRDLWLDRLRLTLPPACECLWLRPAKRSWRRRSSPTFGGTALGTSATRARPTTTSSATILATRTRLGRRGSVKWC
jgi:hypothetical protein